MLKTNFINLSVIVVSTLAAGCGNSQTAKQEEDSKVTQSTTQAKVLETTTFPEINFEPKKREQPSNATEALATLDKLRKLYDWSNIPVALNSNVSTESTFQYVKAWKLLSEQLPYDILWLKELKGDNVSGADSIEIQKIDNTTKMQLDWLENRLPSQMEQSAKNTRNFLEGCIKPMMWNHIEKAANCDMSNSTEVANLLGRENINQLRAEQIRQVTVAFDSLMYFDEVMGHESAWESKRQSFQEIVDRYESKLEQAVDAIQPPQDIGNPDLTKIAVQVLANKQYKLPKAERIIVNAPKKSFAKDHFTIDFGERSIEKSPYRWNEFQVATIEKDGDQYYLWYNTLLYYSVGPKTVPTEKWVLGPRHRSAAISEKNINN